MLSLFSAAPASVSTPLAARLTAEDSRGVVVVLLAILLILGVLLVINQTSRR